jgi:hypothetical protein
MLMVRFCFQWKFLAALFCPKTNPYCYYEIEFTASGHVPLPELRTISRK